MKIKTVTCHHVYNYGASLQAFALQNYLEAEGHDVEILDYRLPNHRRYEWFAPFQNKGRAYSYMQRFPFLKYIYYPYKRRGMLKTWGRKKAFDKFDEDYLHISKETYRTIEEIREASPEADVYIAGSDQIWNTDCDNGRDPGYYLDFGSKDTKRISYAASFGTGKIKDGFEDFVRRQLNRFDCISVRERTGLGILKSLNIDGVQVVDPVFLLSRQEWVSSLGLEEEPGNYIFLYDFLHDDEAIRSFALSLKKKTGLKIVSVNDFSNAPYADKQINDAGPKEFLQWLLNSNYVVCNSFHATAFSLVFHKEFATYPLLRQKNQSRMSDLLESVGLSERFKPTAFLHPLSHSEWKKVDDGLAGSIRNSKAYLTLIG